jgi:hypothetical protein
LPLPSNFKLALRLEVFRPFSAWPKSERNGVPGGGGGAAGQRQISELRCGSCESTQHAPCAAAGLQSEDVPLQSRSTLSVFKSRCSTPWLWMNCRPLMICMVRKT